MKIADILIDEKASAAVTGAGAVGGATIGAVAGGPAGAVAGAAVGAVAGALVSSLANKLAQLHDRKQKAKDAEEREEIEKEIQSTSAKLAVAKDKEAAKAAKPAK